MLMSKVMQIKGNQNPDYKSQWDNNHHALHKSVERKAYETSDGLKQGLTADLTEQIIGSYQTCINEQARDWMSQLAKDSVQYLADRRGIKKRRIREEAQLNNAATSLVNRIYTVLSQFAFDYNGQIGWTELFVTGTKPSIVTEVLRYNILREPLETITHLRARFSTALWSIVVRAQRKKVEFLMIPATKTIGLSKEESKYEPLLQIDGELEAGDVNWYVDGESLSDELLACYLMDLFGKLITFSRDQIHESEVA